VRDPDPHHDPAHRRPLLPSHRLLHRSPARPGLLDRHRRRHGTSTRIVVIARGRSYARRMGGTNAGDASAPETPSPHAPGDRVAIREVWDGRVWYARPAVVVQDEPNLQMFHVPPGVRCKEPVGADGTPLRIPTEDWTLADI